MNTLPEYLGKVERVEIYKNDAVVHRAGNGNTPEDCTRSEITMFSKRSRERLAFIASNTDIVFDAMITLTYPQAYPKDGRLVKKHFRAMLQALRRRGSDLEYLWFVEFQRRGAPHYHVLTRGLTVDTDTKHWLSKRWYEICQSGDEKHLLAGTRLETIRKKDGAKRYCLKYAYKMRQKTVPKDYRNVGRFWGHSKNVTPTPRQEVQCNEDDVVAALQAVGWRYMTGERIYYKVIYGVSDILTDWFDCGILSSNES